VPNVSVSSEIKMMMKTKHGKRKLDLRDCGTFAQLTWLFVSSLTQPGGLVS